MRITTLISAAALLGLAGCKQQVPKEEWARTILVTRAPELSAVEYPAVAALDKFDEQTTANPGSQAENVRALAATLEPLLKEQKWITGYGPATVAHEVNGQSQPITLPFQPFIPVETVKGGSAQMKGIAVPPRQQLFWGLYKTRDDTYGGIEIQSVLRQGHSTLTLHLYVVPGVSQQSLR